MRWLYLLICLISLSSIGAAADPEILTLTIESETKQKIADFKVELADTPEKMSRGLMYRMSLPVDQGMLFVMGAPRIAAFWMHNTYVPLDMIFIRLNGEIESIVAEALSQERTRSLKPVAYVLEINAGQSAVLGIKPGHFIRLESSGGSR